MAFLRVPRSGFVFNFPLSGRNFLFPVILFRKGVEVLDLALRSDSLGGMVGVNSGARLAL